MILMNSHEFSAWSCPTILFYFIVGKLSENICFRGMQHFVINVNMITQQMYVVETV
jgi:hypothetical protein